MVKIIEYNKNGKDYRVYKCDSEASEYNKNDNE